LDLRTLNRKSGIIVTLGQILQVLVKEAIPMDDNTGFSSSSERPLEVVSLVTAQWMQVPMLATEAPVPPICGGGGITHNGQWH